VIDPYRALGLAAGAGGEEITRAYRKMVRRYPPELNPKRFAEIHRAHKMLTALDVLMEEAMAKPGDALESLYPPPVVRLRPAPEPPPRLRTADLEGVLQPLRRDALRRLLKEALSGSGG
jgi:hypothetical protein